MEIFCRPKTKKTFELYSVQKLKKKLKALLIFLKT